MEREKSIERSVTTTFLPWIVAGIGLLVYFVTLNHWVTLGSIVPVAKVSGWTWQPELTEPLYWLVTLPFQLLPAKLVPLALNVLSALCACLTLALLARSVSILPHDRTEDQRIRERSASAILSIRTNWIPPVVAALVCGLQLTFWENATVASSEMLDLVLFAYVIRNLLEFRFDGRESWLLKASLVYGAAMTNNWAMIGFLPLFLVAMVWIRGFGFFDIRFLTRMFLVGLAGLGGYLVLPLVISLSANTQATFWQALKFNLTFEKSYVLGLPFKYAALFKGEPPLWVLGLPSLLPLFLLGFRWPAYFGDPSKLGVAIATLVFHIFHAVLLAVCLWVAFDPQFSPRKLLPGLPMLTFYYLGAIAIGYYVGYFLLVFGAKPLARGRSVSAFMRLINPVVLACLYFLVLAVPAMLVVRNLPEIRVTNGKQLSLYAELISRDLPEKSAVLLADDPTRLLLVKSHLNQAGRDQNFIFIDTASLLWPDYHFFLKRQLQDRWVGELPSNRKSFLQHIDAVQTISTLSVSNQVFYLHPSFGYYFEFFHLEPHGMAYRMVNYTTNSLWIPPLSESLLTSNSAFWSQADESALQPLRKLIAAVGSERSFGRKLLKKLHLEREPNRQARLLGEYYSRSLNCWGTVLQQNNQLTAAGVQFERALELNPENAVAAINLDYNESLRAVRTNAPSIDSALEETFGKYRDWEKVMNFNGPFDEPTALLQQATVFMRGSNLRQAAQSLKRSTELAPENFGVRLGLAGLLVRLNRGDDSLEVIQAISKDAVRRPRETNAAALKMTEAAARFCETNGLAMSMTEALAYLSKQNPPQAEQAIQRVLQKQPNDEVLLNQVVNSYVSYGLYSNALPHAQRLIEVNRDSFTGWLYKGYILMQMTNYDGAVEALTRAMELQSTNNVALFNRAVAYLLSKKYDQAKTDYEKLQEAYPKSFEVQYGLGEVAYSQNDRAAAVHHYQLYLAIAPTNSAEARMVMARLKEMREN